MTLKNYNKLQGTERKHKQLKDLEENKCLRQCPRSYKHNAEGNDEESTRFES